MDAILQAHTMKLLRENKQRACHAAYSLLKSDEARVKYTMELIVEHSMPITPISTSKSASSSTKFRTEGNRLFTMPSHQSLLDESIQCYTKSIAFAPNDSEELALAYANRSAVLFKARLYQDCLLDIDRALGLPYPYNLKAKLYDRRVRCLMTRKITSSAQKDELNTCLENTRLWLEKMDPSSQTSCRIKKSLEDPKKMAPVEKLLVKSSCKTQLPKVKEENAEIPGISSSLELKYSDDYGKYMVATQKIYPGDVLGVMTPYETVLVPEKFYTHCWECLEQTWSSIPCPSCVNVVYCSEECRTKAWTDYHAVECDVMGPLIALEMSNLGLLSLKLAVRAIRDSGGIAELRKRLKELEGKEGRINGFTSGILDDKDYASVYTLTTNTDKRSVPDLFGRSLNTAYIIFMLATRSNIFGEKLGEDLEKLKENAEVLFVGGLIMRHQQIIPSNVHSMPEEGLAPDPIERAAALLPVYSLFNHSCNPQISRVSYGKHVVLYADSIISKGQQVYDNYGLHYALLPRDFRQAKLQQQFRFTCACEACVENWPTYRGLDSFESQYLPSHENHEIKSSMKKFSKYYGYASTGTLQNPSEMVSDLNQMLKTLLLYVEPPCLEICDVLETKKRVLALTANRHQSLTTWNH